MRVAILLLLAVLLVPARVAAAAEEDLATFDAVWSTVKRYFYDPGLHGVDWDAARRTYRPLVAEADGARQVRTLLEDMLAELRASHTAILDREVYRATLAELNGRRSPTFGALIEETLPGRYFVRALYEGGPLAVAGVRVGDRIVQVDGVPVAESPLLVNAGYDPGLPGPDLFFLSAAPGRAAALTIQPHPDAETRQGVRVHAREMSAVDAARNSVAVHESGGIRVGSVHVWFCSRRVTAVLEEALTSQLADCDALVLDIRGRGGFSDVVSAILDLFRGEQSVLQRLSGARSAPLWSRPLVVLTDERSRSGKELLAYQVRRLGLGTVVGQRTEGAVLGATFHALPDGSYLELAGVPVRVDGTFIEGVGVAPDVEVDFALPYCRGRDPILEKGLEVARERVRRARAGERLAGPF